MAITMDYPRPSQAEQLRAEYGDEWDIWREMLPGGEHGAWLAQRFPGHHPQQLLRASTVDELRTALDEASRT